MLFNRSDYSYLKHTWDIKKPQEFSFVLFAINCCSFRCFVLLLLTKMKLCVYNVPFELLESHGCLKVRYISEGVILLPLRQELMPATQAWMPPRASPLLRVTGVQQTAL